MENNKIKRGKFIRDVSSIISILLIIISCVVNFIYTQSVKSKLQDTDKLLNDLGVNRVPTLNIALIILILGIVIFISGGIISSIMCKCNKCGYSVISRYGTLCEYCPKCGRRVEYSGKIRKKKI